MDFNYMERDRPKKASFVKMRLMITILTTFCPIVCYISRQNLPFAIVSMVQDEEAATATGPERGLASNSDAHQDNVIGNRRPVPDSLLGDDLGLLDGLELGSNSRPGGSIMDVSQRHRMNATRDSSEPASAAGPRDTCPNPTITDESGKTTTLAKAVTFGPKYSWSQRDKGFLLGAFFYTYVAFQIPGARLAEQVGAKWILAAASLGSAFLSLLTPWSASVHVHVLSTVRILMGVFQAALYPACYVLYSKWLPPTERSQALPLLMAGAYVGSIIASALTGYFSESEQFGWQYSFYVPGVLCLLWSFVWIWFASNEPHGHKYISIEELHSIEQRMEVRRVASSKSSPVSSSVERLELEDGDNSQQPQATSPVTDSSGSSSSGKKEISWSKLFTSRSIWAMIAAFVASNWSFSIVLLLIPTYLNNILRVSPLENSMINSVIYVIYCVASPLVGPASTMMVETRACGLTRLGVRKLFQGTALLSQSVCFVLIAWFGCERAMVFGVLYVQIVFFSLVNGGEVQLPSELSVDFSGTIYAIGNCIGSSTGFIVPTVYGMIVADEFNRAHWDLYFYVAAVVTALGGSIFLLFGQNKMQDFSKDPDDERSRLDFANFGGLAGVKGGSFSLDSSRQQKQPTVAARLSSIKSLPPLKQGQEFS